MEDITKVAGMTRERNNQKSVGLDEIRCLLEFMSGWKGRSLNRHRKLSVIILPIIFHVCVEADWEVFQAIFMDIHSRTYLISREDVFDPFAAARAFGSWRHVAHSPF